MKSARLPPGPRGLSMFFAFLRLLRDPLGSTTELVRRYGDIVRLRVGTMQSYLLTSPELIEEVLRHQHRCFRKDSGTRLLSGFLGQGLLTNEGETWRRQRRLACAQANPALPPPGAATVSIRCPEGLFGEFM